MKYLQFLFLLIIHTLRAILAEECKLENICRLVDINGDDEWIKDLGHYRVIQECIDEANPGDTCLIRPGSYHEEIIIRNKNNLAIRGDLDYERPIIDGTVVLKPKDNDKSSKGNKWKEDFINGEKVCIGEIEIMDDKHPFQLFLKENEEYDMMTNARWPNALWIERHPETEVPLVFYNDYWGKSDETSVDGKMVDRKDENGVSPLAASGLDMTGAMGILNIGSFASWHRPITSHNAGDDYFLYDTHDINNLHPKPKRAQYYIDSKENLLDNPGEWFYNKNTHTLKFMPPSGLCPDASSDAVRGRVIDYAMTISMVDGLYISDLNFFASNLIASAESKHKDDIKELYLDSVNFLYPVSSHRMLQDDSLPKTTNLVAQNGGPMSITNCVFFGGEGTALLYDGNGIKMHNNLFKWNDWSGIMDGGGAGTIWTYSHENDEEFIGNTMWYNGASAGLRPGHAALITNNLFVGQREGNIMNDGAGVQLMTSRARWLHFERNWMFDSPVSGVRIDGSGSGSVGYNCSLTDNVAWKTGGYMLKGDYHNVTGNLALINNDGNKNEGGLRVMYILRHDTDPNHIMNNNSRVENNAAWLADGGKEVDCPQHGQGRYALAGIKSNNYYGNHSFSCDEGEYDGSVMLDGEVVPDVSYSDLVDLLVDVENFDFRPKPDTILTSTGTQIGPYPSVYSNGDTYFIPGRKEIVPSHPIPKHDSKIEIREDLIFQPAYRCYEVDDKHQVYIAKNSTDFPPNDQPTTELAGDGNVVVFKDIGFTVVPNIWYKWRVDCLKGATNKRLSSNTWVFRMLSAKHN